MEWHQKLAGAATVVVAIMIGGLALWQMREAAQLLLIALAVSAALGPAVTRLSARGLRREWAIGLVLLMTLALLALALVGIGSQVLYELEQIGAELPAWYDQLRESLRDQGGWPGRVVRQLPASGDVVDSLMEVGSLGNLLMGAATGLTIGVVLLLSAVSLGFYWLLDQTRIERLWLSLLPAPTRQRVRSVWMRVYDEVGLYMRGGAAVASLTTAMLLLAYLGLGLPGAALLALIGGLALIVPVVGWMIALLPPLLVALAHEPASAPLTAAVTLGLIGLVKLGVAPRLFRQGVAVNPLLSLICIMALGEVGGIWLILLGPPLAAAIQTTVQALRSEQPAALPLPADTARQNDALDQLDTRLDTIAAGVSDSPAAPQIGSLIDRARSLIQAARQAARQG